MEKVNYIHKSRSIETLVEVLRQGVHKYMTYFPWGNKKKPPGMCGVASRMESDNYISMEEYKLLKDWLIANSPENKLGINKLWWPKHKKAVRVLWLTTMIQNPDIWKRT